MNDSFVLMDYRPDSEKIMEEFKWKHRTHLTSRAALPGRRNPQQDSGRIISQPDEYHQHCGICCSGRKHIDRLLQPKRDHQSEHNHKLVVVVRLEYSVVSRVISHMGTNSRAAPNIDKAERYTNCFNDFGVVEVGVPAVGSSYIHDLSGCSSLVWST